MSVSHRGGASVSVHAQAKGSSTAWSVPIEVTASGHAQVGAQTTRGPSRSDSWQSFHFHSNNVALPSPLTCPHGHAALTHRCQVLPLTCCQE